MAFPVLRSSLFLFLVSGQSLGGMKPPFLVPYLINIPLKHLLLPENSPHFGRGEGMRSCWCGSVSVLTLRGWLAERVELGCTIQSPSSAGVGKHYSGYCLRRNCLYSWAETTDIFHTRHQAPTMASCSPRPFTELKWWFKWQKYDASYLPHKQTCFFLIL